jgi:hypothetical protein
LKLVIKYHEFSKFIKKIIKKPKFSKISWHFSIFDVKIIEN